MISREGNEEFSKTRNCHLRSTCSNCKCKSQVGTVQLVHGGKNQVSWGCKNKSHANTWISESWKVRSPVTHLEYPKRCAEVFICPHDRRHDHYSLQALSFSLLPFPRPGRALSSPLLLYSSLPPSPPLSLSLSPSLCTCPIISLLFRATNTAYIYACVVCMCVFIYQTLRKQRNSERIARQIQRYHGDGLRVVSYIFRVTRHTQTRLVGAPQLGASKQQQQRHHPRASIHRRCSDGWRNARSIGRPDWETSTRDLPREHRGSIDPDSQPAAINCKTNNERSVEPRPSESNTVDVVPSRRQITQGSKCWWSAATGCVGLAGVITSFQNDSVCLSSCPASSVQLRVRVDTILRSYDFFFLSDRNCSSRGMWGTLSRSGPRGEWNAHESDCVRRKKKQYGYRHALPFEAHTEWCVRPHRHATANYDALDWRRLRSRLPRSILSGAGCPGESVGERSSPKICEDPRFDTLSSGSRHESPRDAGFARDWPCQAYA